MPLSEVYLTSKYGNKKKANSSSDEQPSAYYCRPENEQLELLLDNGQIVMKVPSNRSKKVSFMVNDLHSIDGSLQNDFYSEFFSEHAGVQNPKSFPNARSKMNLHNVLFGSTSRSTGVSEASRSAGLMNFTHFLKPVSLARADLLSIERLKGHEKSHTNSENVLNSTTLAGIQESSASTQTKADKGAEIVVTAAASSVFSENSAGAATDDSKQKLKRKSNGREKTLERSDDLEEETIEVKKSSSKRTRAAEVHNLSERRRRDRINEKMRALQELIPNCNKVDKASMLDEAIEYLRTLQLQVQMMSMGRGLHMPNFSPLGLCMGMAMKFGMGMINFNSSPGLILVDPLLANQFPCPSVQGDSGFQRIMPPSSSYSSVHPIGIHEHMLPLSVHQATPLVSSQAGFPSQVSDTIPSCSKNQQ